MAPRFNPKQPDSSPLADLRLTVEKLELEARELEAKVRKRIALAQLRDLTGKPSV